MKRMTILLLLLALPIVGGTAGENDTEFLVNHLKKTQQIYADALTGLTPEQWKFTPGPDRWSIQQCAEHLAVTESFLREAAEKVLNSPPATAEQKEAAKGKDAMVMKMVTDRSQRFKAPEPVQPKGDPSLEDVRGRFEAERQKTFAMVKSAGDGLRNHVSKHPAFQETDAYQWVLFLSSHVERHVAQMKEVKEHADYP